jgi:hypothetical protein
MTSSGDDWAAHKLLVMKSLDKMEDQLATAQEDIMKIRLDAAKEGAKWGLLMSIIVGAIATAVKAGLGI